MFKHKINFSDEDVKNIYNLYISGKLQKEIAEEYGVSRSSIERILHKNPSYQSKHPLVDKTKENEIVRLYLEGYKQNEISKILSTSDTTIKSILINNNINIRSLSESCSKYNLDSNYFENIDTSDKAYILGLLCADGTIGLKTNAIVISLQEKDRHILDEINRKLSSNRPLSLIKLNDKNPNWSNQYSLNIVNKKMHDDLINQGVIPQKSLKLEFPSNIPEELYSSFILGYMDGDGNISKNEDRCTLIGTESFCLRIKEILSNILNINSSIMLCHNNDSVTTRTLQVAGKYQVKKFLDWLYQNCNMHLNRKYEIYCEKYLNTLSI